MKQSNYISFDRFKSYFKKQMNAKDEHELEKVSMQNGFDSDAYDGFADFNMDEVEKDIDYLQLKLDPKMNRKKMIWFPYAASIVVLIAMGIGYFVDFSKNQQGIVKDPIAMNEARKPEDKIETAFFKDSLPADGMSQAVNDKSDDSMDEVVHAPQEKFTASNAAQKESAGIEEDAENVLDNNIQLNNEVLEEAVLEVQVKSAGPKDIDAAMDQMESAQPTAQPKNLMADRKNRKRVVSSKAETAEEIIMNDSVPRPPVGMNEYKNMIVQKIKDEVLMPYSKTVEMDFSFIVLEDGRADNFNFKNKRDPRLNYAVKKAFRDSDKWRPAMVDGKPVVKKVDMLIVIEFGE